MTGGTIIKSTAKEVTKMKLGREGKVNRRIVNISQIMFVKMATLIAPAKQDIE